MTEQFSLVDNEHEMLKFWEENQIFQKSLEQTKDKEPYIFYDGPPFATGLPHHGHLLASTIKDVIPRYQTMRGRYVERRFGWDCHGLPIEQEIDKSLGMSSKDAVEKLGIDGYNKECRAIVQRYSKEWRKTISRLGRWVDFEHDYKTMEPWYMESVWWVVRQLWERDLIYQGKKVVPVSTALGTVLSNFEAGSNYQMTQDPGITVLFRRHGGLLSYFAVWTTTPWTLLSNMALCVNENIDYVMVRDKRENKRIIFAKSCLENMRKKRPESELEIIYEMKGTSLVDASYSPIFQYFPKEIENGHNLRIVADDFVSDKTGTGIVHMAPAFGEEDFRVATENGINVDACPVDMHGILTREVGSFYDFHVKEADKPIIDYLKYEKDCLYIHDTVEHSYPFCPRTDTPIIYRTVPSWYVRVEQLRDKLAEINKNIHWVPEHIQEGRMGKWLAQAKDWAISRNRYWGTPLPIWVNDETGNTYCVSSMDELQKLTGEKVTDLHRESVDHLTFTFAGEKGTYRRVEEVLDCWFESGAMPYAQQHYPFENKEKFENGFPAEFIAEGLDQTRGWFYTLMVLGAALFDKPAFKNVVVNGIVTAKDGKKMAKRLRNYTPPDELMEEYGADALRLSMLNSGLTKAEEMRFSDAAVKEMARKVLLPWYNACQFFCTYAEVDNWQPAPPVGTYHMDSWIHSRLETLKTNVNEEMEKHHLYAVMPQFLDFMNDLTNWYIRLNRKRFWAEGMEEDKNSAYCTLYRVLKELSMLMAPFAPFLSEHLYQKLIKVGKEINPPMSVHLCQYPTSHSASKPEIEEAMKMFQDVVVMGRKLREEVRIKVKIPLKRLTVIHKDENLLNTIALFEDYLMNELNVKAIVYDTNEESYIEKYAMPDAKVLGKRFKKRFNQFKTLIGEMDTEQINLLENNGSISLNGEVINIEEVRVFREARTNLYVETNKYISVELDCELTKASKTGGTAREIVSKIQNARKQMGFHVADRIHVKYNTTPEIWGVVESCQEYICQETLTTHLESVDTQQEIVFEIEIEGEQMSVTLTKDDSYV